MENKSLIMFIPIIVAVFGIAIYLDSQNCKSLTDVGDILGGGKIKRLEQENASLREHNKVLSRELHAIRKQIRDNSVDDSVVANHVYSTSNYVREDLPKLKPISHKPHHISFNASNRVKYKQYSNKSLSAMSLYRKDSNEYFTKVWNNWKKHPELRDVDLVIVKITINKDGKIIAKNIESSASKVLTDEIIKEFDKYKFKPIPSETEKETMTFRYTFGKNSYGIGSS